MRILFQGDSITDAGRVRGDIHNLAGYTTMVAEILKKQYPNEEFEFINLGIGGNRTLDLVQRYETDFRDIQPDIVSIMIGVNDVWHAFAYPEKYISSEGTYSNYKYILRRLKADTNAKIVMLEPYLLPEESMKKMKMDLNAVIERCRELAVEFADEYVPLDGIFAKECMKTPWSAFCADGVHPGEKGQAIIAKYCAEAIANQIDEIIKNRN
ncbi:MAG: SGNH/GDSL hydrolase family protein [Clostridia bacterium]|nr:SGNH/GDSL hydrolase family protein [Clostridia bacterium]